jgi:hypothetical protein
MAEKLKVIKIIHLFICAGVLVFYLFLGDLTSLTSLKIPDINATTIIYVIIPILSVLVSNFLFYSQLKKIDKNLQIEDKLQFYQSASITRWAILEGGAFLILFLKPDFLIFGLLIIVYLIMIRPTENQIRNDLDKTSTKI